MYELSDEKKAQRIEILKLVPVLYPHFAGEGLVQLIDATDTIKGVSFISLKGYSSDATNNTELQDHIVNVGASYANMLGKDEEKLKAFDIATLDCSKIFWDLYNIQERTREEFMAAVKADAPIALAEMLLPKKKKDMSHVVYINKVLSFDTNTQRLSIRGMKIKGVVTVEGEQKQTKSSPKTVAKQLIGKQADLSTHKLRTYCLDNLMSTIKAMGDTIEIQCTTC
jgi:hypothetical protein